MFGRSIFESPKYLIQMENIIVFSGIEFLLRKLFQIVHMKKAIEPYYREEDYQKFGIETTGSCNNRPEKSHNAEPLFEEAHVHFSGTGNQGTDKK